MTVEIAPLLVAQSAAAPSPFPPIADYAFLSDCHTGALVAPDGAIDWLCVTAFDSPSVFGSLLDRQAGYFRLGPFGIHHPTSRVYEPGTNILETTWKTPRGWIVVRDALTIGPREREDEVTPHTRPPADEDADHLMIRTVRCLEGTVEVEPGERLGRRDHVDRAARQRNRLGGTDHRVRERKAVVQLGQLLWADFRPETVWNRMHR